MKKKSISAAQMFANKLLPGLKKAEPYRALEAARTRLPLFYSAAKTR